MSAARIAKWGLLFMLPLLLLVAAYAAVELLIAGGLRNGWLTPWWYAIMLACAAFGFMNPLLKWIEDRGLRTMAGVGIVAVWCGVLFVATLVLVFLHRGDAL